MKKGRSTYTLQFNCDENIIHQLMQSYLNANVFQIIEKKGEQYYRTGDQMIGYRCLTYSIMNKTITINAWLDGALGNFPLEQNSLNIMAMNYRNSLVNLFQKIEKLNNGGMNMNNNGMDFDANKGQPINNNYQQPTQQTNEFIQSFQDETTKKQEKMCEIGFWLSILGILGSLGGVVMGLVVYIMDFYFASQGLKTRKRGKAIATIVLSILSIIIVIIQLMAANTL